MLRFVGHAIAAVDVSEMDSSWPDWKKRLHAALVAKIDQGVSQRRICRDAVVSPSYLRALFKNPQQQARRDELRRICAAIGASLMWIEHGVEDASESEETHDIVKQELSASEVPAEEDPRALEMLAFWWGAGPDRWFSPDDGFDGQCRTFESLVEEAAAGALDDWRRSAAGTLALILLLDQLPRNLFRGTRRAFATDAKALEVADAAIATGYHRGFPFPARAFFLMPFMHAEDLATQERSLDLFRASGDQHSYYHALVHHDAVRRFGRFPHRNSILGRQTTPEEQAYLDTGGFAA